MQKNKYDELCEKESEFFNSFIKKKIEKGLPLYLDIRKGQRIDLPYGNIEDDPKIEKLTKSKFRQKILEQVFKDCRVLELGCGVGGLSLEMARNGAIVDAHDVSRENIKIARDYLNSQKNISGEINYFCSDANKIILQKDHYDLVVCWEALHHFKEIEHVINEIKKSLKNNGKFIFFEHVNLGKGGKFILGLLYPFLSGNIIPTPFITRIKKISMFLTRNKIKFNLDYCNLQQPPFEDISVDKVIPVSQTFFPNIKLQYTLVFSAIILGRMKLKEHIHYPTARTIKFIDDALRVLFKFRGQFAYGEALKTH